MGFICVVLNKMFPKKIMEVKFVDSLKNVVIPSSFPKKIVEFDIK